MKLTELMGAAIVVLAGCGDAGPASSSDAGVGAAACRAPAGCTATLVNGGCVYGCASDGGQPRAVCIQLPDGGAADQSEFPPSLTIPLALAQAAAPYAVSLESDPANCTRCGRRCAPREVCGRAPGNLVVTCYLP